MHESLYKRQPRCRCCAYRFTTRGRTRYPMARSAATNTGRKRAFGNCGSFFPLSLIASRVGKRYSRNQMSVLLADLKLCTCSGSYSPLEHVPRSSPRCQSCPRSPPAAAPTGKRFRRTPARAQTRARRWCCPMTIPVNANKSYPKDKALAAILISTRTVSAKERRR